MNDSITNSAAKCWRNCRRQYLYRYERPIKPISMTRSYALRLGSLFHGAQEVWWITRDLVRVERYLQEQCVTLDEESLTAYHTARLMMEGYVIR